MTIHLDDVRNMVSAIRQRHDGGDPTIVRLPSFAALDIKRLLANRSHTQVKHIFPVRTERIDARCFDLHLWRQLPQKNVKVSRLYMVPHVGFARHLLDECTSLDRASSIQVSVITVSKAADSQMHDALSESIVIDDSIIMRSVKISGNDDGFLGYEWIVSNGSRELETADIIWRSLWLTAAEATSNSSAYDLEEPLVASADLIGGVARVLCSGDHVDRMDCSWYHGAWQYMRLLDLVSTPTWHHDFYKQALMECFRENPNARVLISGTADYSLLAYVLLSARETGAEPRVTVLDQCATPLFACRWLARQAGFPLETSQADILDGPRVFSATFDVVTSDAFLTRFSPEVSKKVVDVWRSLCTPGSGRLITTVRIHGEAASVRGEEEAASAFVERARARLPKWQDFLRKPPHVLLEEIDTYARKMVSNKLGSEGDIVTLLSNGGFTVLHNGMHKVPGELYPSVYLRLIAQ